MLSLEGVDLITKLREEGVEEGALTYLELNAGHKNIMLKRLMGWQTVQESIATADADIENDKTGKKQIEFEEFVKADKVDIYYKNKTRDALRKLGLNDRFIDTHYGSAIEQFSNTRGLTQKLEYKKVKFAQDLQETVTSISNLTSNPNLNPLVASTELHNLVKKFRSIDKVKGKSNAVIFLHRLNKDGKINSTVIDAMKQGKITDFDPGDKGEKLFSDSDWRYIEQGEQEYLTQVKTDHDDKYAARGLQYEAGIIDKTITQEQLESFLLEADSNGQSGTDWYKKLSRYNSNAYN